MANEPDPARRKVRLPLQTRCFLPKRRRGLSGRACLAKIPDCVSGVKKALQMRAGYDKIYFAR